MAATMTMRDVQTLSRTVRCDSLWRTVHSASAYRKCNFAGRRRWRQRPPKITPTKLLQTLEREKRGSLNPLQTLRGFCPAKSWLKAGPKQTFTTDGFERLWNATMPRIQTLLFQDFFSVRVNKLLEEKTTKKKHHFVFGLLGFN